MSTSSLPFYIRLEADQPLIMVLPNQNSDLIIKEIYDLFAQELYGYGMLACGDDELVRHSLEKLFCTKRYDLALPSDNKSVRFCLYKSFRELLVQGISELKKSSDLFSNELTNSITQHGSPSGLSSGQREAIYLNFQRAFSYQEVESIMKITTSSAFELITHTIDMTKKKM